MSMKDFVRKAERRSKESINDCYRSIDMLHYEINFLNDLLTRYSNRKSGNTLTTRQRLSEMNSIRERIPRVYQDINYYKECINAEKKEMKRIYDTYGYGPNKEVIYEKPEQVNYTDYSDIRDEYRDEEEEEEDEYCPPYDDFDELEEIKQYEFNYITDSIVEK